VTDTAALASRCPQGEGHTQWQQGPEIKGPR
jgi:hypothetical protein